MSLQNDLQIAIHAQAVSVNMGEGAPCGTLPDQRGTSGRYSAFFATLTCMAASEENRKSQAGSVIVVDDDPLTRQILRDTLEGGGFSVFEATDSDDCFNLLTRISPVAIFLDVVMPVHSGYHVCKTIREYYPNLKCPILFITARKTAADVARAREVGGDHFIVKPFDPETVLQRLTYLRRHARRKTKAMFHSIPAKF